MKVIVSQVLVTMTRLGQDKDNNNDDDDDDDYDGNDDHSLVGLGQVRSGQDDDDDDDDDDYSWVRLGWDGSGQVS